MDVNPECAPLNGCHVLRSVVPRDRRACLRPRVNYWAVRVLQKGAGGHGGGAARRAAQETHALDQGRLLRPPRHRRLKRSATIVGPATIIKASVRQRPSRCQRVTS